MDELRRFAIIVVALLAYDTSRGVISFLQNGRVKAGCATTRHLQYTASGEGKAKEIIMIMKEYPINLRVPAAWSHEDVMNALWTGVELHSKTNEALGYFRHCLMIIGSPSFVKDFVSPIEE